MNHSKSKYKKSDLILRFRESIPTYHVSLNGQIKFYSLAGMLLEAAAKHANLIGYGYHDMMRDKVYWVLSRFHVQVQSYPMMDEEIIIETWPKGMNRLFFLRDYRILSASGIHLAFATTAWLIVDGRKGRPKKIDEDYSPNGLSVDNQHAIEKVPDKLPPLGEPDRTETTKACYSDLDINKHVTAVKYIEWIQDFYNEKQYTSNNVKEFQINYHLETRFGEEVMVKMKESKGTDPFDYFEGVRVEDQNPAFRARIQFGRYE